MAHTPGPWKVEVDDDGACWIRIPQGHDLCFGDMETTDSCCFENANLIASAPDMVTQLAAQAAEIARLREVIVSGRDGVNEIICLALAGYEDAYKVKDPTNGMVYTQWGKVQKDIDAIFQLALAQTVTDSVTGGEDGNNE